MIRFIQRRRCWPIGTSLTILALLAGPLQRCQAQGRSTGEYMSQAFLRVTALSAVADSLGRYGYSDGICIVGGWVDAGQTMPFALTLERGYEYLILAGGDNDAFDVDMEVVDSRGNVLESDTKTDPSAVVPFAPRATGVYTLRLTLYKSRMNVPCVCVLTVLKKGGWTVPLKNLAQAGIQLVDGLAVADTEARSRYERRVDLRRAPNQWAFFGAVLKSGTGISAGNMDLGRGFRMFVGVGDNFCDDANLYLLDEDYRTLKEDTRRDKIGVLSMEARGGRHGLRIENASSRGPSVCLMAVLDVR
jgi:hypothetical protein